MSTLAKPAALPPMLQQYVDYKAQYADCLLFFQVGDFYELFFEDAVTVAKTLNLTLTSRDKNNPNPVPMCGVPLAVVDSYVERLVSARFSVAIVSQKASLNDQGKQVITRHLERIITPGIRILGNQEQENFDHPVAAVHLGADDEVAIAFSTVQSGRLLVRENLCKNALIQELLRISPVEVVLPSSIQNQKVDRRLSWVSDIERGLPFASVKMRTAAEENVSRLARNLTDIPGYSQLGSSAKKAAQLLLRYIDETTVNVQVPVSLIEQEGYNDVVAIDATTRRNLELVRNLKDGSSEGTLFEFLDYTLTPGGSRALRHQILHPLMGIAALRERQSLVELLLRESELRHDARECLRYVNDLERISARIELGVILPREVMALRDALSAAKKLLRIWDELNTRCEQSIEALTGHISALSSDSKLKEILENALDDNPQANLNQGGVIRDGYNSELDRLRELKQKGSSWIAELEAAEKKRTGINSLKIKYNNVIGYFIEVTASNSSKVPADYIRRQSTANTERFTTHELRAREKELLGAESRITELERRLFDELREKLKTFVIKIRQLARCISEIDYFLSLAECAERNGLICPELDESQDLLIEGGKHPVLMRLLREAYVPTDLAMGAEDKSFAVLTGPNMGGKSTYLRQAALICILAQIGSFVPARYARIGLVDKIFARLGASDNQHEGESTFMVEMREASYIISNASRRSLVLIDEIGRGTATADGLAIAQAILEWIAGRVFCRTLFATHFHELTVLEERLPNLYNCSVQSLEQDEDVIFTHNIVPGPASCSYGLEVAKIAGLPSELINRARQVLAGVPKRQLVEPNPGKQLSFFSKTPKDTGLPKEELARLQSLKARVQEIDPENTTPLMALNLLSELKKHAG